MNRFYLSLVAISLLTATVGCRMCAHPYDYCGPLYQGDCGGVPCDPCARAGSILSPPLHLPGHGQVIVEGDVIEGETIIRSQPTHRPGVETLPPETTIPVSRRPANYRAPARHQASASRTTSPRMTAQRSPTVANRSPQRVNRSDSVSADLRSQIPRGAVVLSETDAIVSPAGSPTRSVSTPTTSRHNPIMQASTGWQRLR